MALANSKAPNLGCVVARTVSGNSPQIIEIPGGRSAIRQWTTTELAHGVAADTGTSTGVAKKGAWVYLSSTYALEAYPGAMVATGGDVAFTRDVLGLLLDDLTVDTTGLVKVKIAVANADTIFETNVRSQTSTTTATVNASLVGRRFAASVNGSRFYLDLTASGAGFATVGQFVCTSVEDANRTLYGRVQFVSRYGRWSQGN